jgi:cytochrome c biogenesis protein CcdA
MYLPTLVFMSRDGGGFRAWGMLLLYNILFIVPLFAVFLLGAFGVRSQRLAELTRRHVVPSKILLSLVFFALAVFLLLYALEKG